MIVFDDERAHNSNGAQDWSSDLGGSGAGPGPWSTFFAGLLIVSTLYSTIRVTQSMQEVTRDPGAMLACSLQVCFLGSWSAKVLGARPMFWQRLFALSLPAVALGLLATGLAGLLSPERPLQWPGFIVPEPPIGTALEFLLAGYLILLFVDQVVARERAGAVLLGMLRNIRMHRPEVAANPKG
jgi:hypothetical protein